MRHTLIAASILAGGLVACSSGDDPSPTATSVAFVTQPVGAPAGEALATQPVVEVRDQNGDRLIGSTIAVTLALGANPSAATLGGTTTLNAVDGRATFAGLTVDKAGTGYTLAASASGLASATSSEFGMSATRAIAIVSGSSQSGPAGTALAQPIKVKVTETVGGTAQAGVTVYFSAYSGSGSVTPNMVITDVNGEAQATWTLGASGPQTANAGLSSDPFAEDVTFTATIVSGVVLQSMISSLQPGTGSDAILRNGLEPMARIRRSSSVQ